MTDSMNSVGLSWLLLQGVPVMHVKSPRTGTKWTKKDRGKLNHYPHDPNYFAAVPFEVTVSVILINDLNRRRAPT